MKILNKPILLEKFRKFHRSIRENEGKIGTNLRVIELVCSNRCNFKCQHCSTRASRGDYSGINMPVEKISDIADQAHDLGIFELNFHGGELLTQPEYLFEAIKAVKPERFYVFLTSNGYLLDQEMANRLASAGVDRVSISIDSMDPQVHDSFRGVKGAFDRAVNALRYVKNAGMDPFLNVTVGHFNAFSDDLEKLLQYSKENGYTTFINIAIPSGSWQNNFGVLLDQQDREHLIELRKKYGNVLRDIWNPFDRNNEGCLGCQTISKLYITPTGDVFPCSFLHIKIGNIYEQGLKEVVEYGYSIKYFRNHSDVCLAGENIEFIKKYMQKEMSVFKPLDAKEAFTQDDYV